MNENERMQHVYMKNNMLISSIHTWDIYANKLMGCILAKANEFTKTSSGIYEMKIAMKELVTLFKKTSHSLYEQLKEASNEICKPICISSGQKRSFSVINLFSAIDYRKGIFTVYVNENMLILIRGMQSRYTKFNLEMMLKFKSIYAFRLYEILKREIFKLEEEKSTLNVEINTFELRFLLGTIRLSSRSLIDRRDKDMDYEKEFMKIKAKDTGHLIKYPEWNSFKTYVIDTAINEINSVTDINVSVSNGIHTRNGIKTVVFTIKQKQNQNQKEKECGKNKGQKIKKTTETNEKARKMLINSNIKEFVTIDDETVNKVLKEAGNDLEKIKTAISVVKEANNVMSATGFLLSAIKNSYTPKRKFVSGQREYDFDELEKQLINR